LTISAAGTYLLNGRLVKPEELEGELLAMHKNAPSLGLNIRAAPDATYHSIAVAVTTAQRVGIDTWFTTAAPAK
jgi:biopolymer transport protein ExbD